MAIFHKSILLLFVNPYCWQFDMQHITRLKTIYRIAGLGARYCMIKYAQSLIMKYSIQGDGPKKFANFLYANINQLSKFSHCRNQKKIYNNTITKDPANIKVRIFKMWKSNLTKLRRIKTCAIFGPPCTVQQQFTIAHMQQETRKSTTAADI